MQLDFNVTGEVRKILVRGENGHIVTLGQGAKKKIRVRPLDSFGSAQRQNGRRGFIILRLYEEIVKIPKFSLNSFKVFLHRKAGQKLHAHNPCQDGMSIIKQFIELRNYRENF